MPQLHMADGFWSRFVGLQFRRPLPAECGLLLIPCPAVHTCFVRFALDLIYLDREGRILAIRRNLRPWRHARGPAGTYATLETCCGAVQAEPGERLAVRPLDRDRPLPRSLAFLAAAIERRLAGKLGRPSPNY